MCAANIYNMAILIWILHSRQGHNPLHNDDEITHVGRAVDHMMHMFNTANTTIAIPTPAKKCKRYLSIYNWIDVKTQPQIFSVLHNSHSCKS